MYKSLMKESFFNNLTPTLKKKCIALCKCNKQKILYNKISLFILLITGTFFILVFKDIILIKDLHISLNTMFFYAKCLVLILGGFMLSNAITKNSTAKYQSNYSSLKNSLNIDICTCKKECTCKKDLKNFFEKNGINL